MSQINAVKTQQARLILLPGFCRLLLQGLLPGLELWVSNTLTAHEVDILINLGPVYNASISIIKPIMDILDLFWLGKFIITGSQLSYIRLAKLYKPPG
jgi:hypothetical protein